MIYTTCRACGVSLEIDENDYMPGCRDTEEVMCPKCNKIATTVRTSGFPSAKVVSDEVMNEVHKLFNIDKK